MFDFEWLWVGRVRFWFVIDWCVCYVHEFLNTNNLDEVYMTNPNAPIRYEISNDWTGWADTFDTICATIQSEWGQEATSITTWASRNWTPITLANQDLRTPLVSVRLKSDAICTRVTPWEVSVFISSTDNYEWGLFINPTIWWTDAVSWTDITNSACQYDITRNNTNTLTWGYLIAWGYWSSTNQWKSAASWTAQSFLTIWSNIDWTLDELVLACKNIDWNGWTAYWWVNLSEYC
jgi:hypothetical protein